MCGWCFNKRMARSRAEQYGGPSPAVLKAFECVQELLAQTGHFPSHRELMQAMRWKSPRAAAWQFAKMEQAGLITSVNGKREIANKEQDVENQGRGTP